VLAQSHVANSIAGRVNELVDHNFDDEVQQFVLRVDPSPGFQCVTSVPASRWPLHFLTDFTPCYISSKLNYFQRCSGGSNWSTLYIIASISLGHYT
jgi:hypothetical protein